MNGAVLAVGFWCSASDKSWSWTPQPYIGAWLIVGAVVGLAVWWKVRGRASDPLVAAAAANPPARAGIEADEGADPAPARLPDGVAAAVPVDAPRRGREAMTEGSGPPEGSSGGRTVALVCGAIGLWAVLDWPLATLGAGYLATAQLIRQVVMVMVVAPLLLFAIPAPLAVRMVGWGRRLTVLRWTARPVVAVPVTALTLVLCNAPAIVVPLVATQYGAFVLDLAWIVAGFVLWMPVQCPHPGVRRLTGPAALGYLIAQSIVPVLPGFWMTWSDAPLYATYELAPRVFPGFGPVDDQNTAAAVLQVGGMVFLWLQISYRFIHWANQQLEGDRRNRKPIARTVAPNP